MTNRVTPLFIPFTFEPSEFVEDIVHGPQIVTKRLLNSYLKRWESLGIYVGDFDGLRRTTAKNSHPLVQYVHRILGSRSGPSFPHASKLDTAVVDQILPSQLIGSALDTPILGFASKETEEITRALMAGATKGDSLIIIDPYFTSPKQSEARKELRKQLGNTDIRSATVCCCYFGEKKQLLKLTLEAFPPKTKVALYAGPKDPCLKDFHDRYFVFGTPSSIEARGRAVLVGQGIRALHHEDDRSLVKGLARVKFEVFREILEMLKGNATHIEDCAAELENCGIP